MTQSRQSQVSFLKSLITIVLLAVFVELICVEKINTRENHLPSFSVLADISWFMRCLNEFIGKANKKGECSGAFIRCYP